MDMTTSVRTPDQAATSGVRRAARAGYRWLLLVFLLAVAVQIFLAGLGVFDLDGHKLGSSGETAFDPHRLNGNIMSAVALVLLVLILVARPGARLIVQAVVLFLLMAVAQPLLADAGEDQAWVGGLHAIIGVGLLGLASRLLVETKAGPAASS